MTGIYFKNAQALADALNNVRCFHDLGAELIAEQVFADSKPEAVGVGVDVERAELLARIEEQAR